MKTPYANLEQQVERAAAQARAHASGKLNVAKLAREFKVPERRLRRRIEGKDSKSTRPPTNRKLNDAQEEALLAWVQTLDDLGLAARPSLIRGSANQMLLQAHTDPDTPVPTVGQKWVRNFIKRYPQLQLVKQKTQELLRMSHDYALLAEYFDKLQKIIQVNGITEHDIWNFDECGFRIDVGGQQWAVTVSPEREARLGSSTNREMVTIIEAVSAAGDVISPFIIVPGVLHSEAWAQNDLPGDTSIAVSESGYSDDVLALQYIQHFIHCTAQLRRGAVQLLVFDGHGSHCTQQFIERCIDNSIIPFTIPPHSSHFLQPLDVAVFQPYKHWHKDAVDQATRFGDTNYGKVEFLASLNQIRIKTFKANTIKNGFRATGIWPLNPQEVLQHYSQDLESAHSTPAPEAPSTSAPQTPMTPRSLKLSIQELERRTLELSPSLQRHVSTLSRGAMIQAFKGGLAVAALKQQTAAQLEREKRKERASKVVQSGGVVKRSRARTICQQKLDDETHQQQRREWLHFKKSVTEWKQQGGANFLTEIRRVVRTRKNRKFKNIISNLDSDAIDLDQDMLAELWKDAFGEEK